ncbi:hypothetical protein [Planobispora longispora]|uniref:hypothetical protein n=1 Tax=Planobispora longispora TaxID=28887 RepID=UPI0019417BB9|nr:hypothetical protein [Planobispora longispora]
MRMSRAAWALIAGALTWVAAFFAFMAVGFPLELRECGADPFTGYETERCALVGEWGSAAARVWVAGPLLWLLAGLSLRLLPERLVRTRRLVVWSVPALPGSDIAAQAIVYMLYGPPLV